MAVPHRCVILRAELIAKTGGSCVSLVGVSGSPGTFDIFIILQGVLGLYVGIAEVEPKMLRNSMPEIEYAGVPGRVVLIVFVVPDPCRGVIERE